MLAVVEGNFYLYNILTKNIQNYVYLQLINSSFKLYNWLIQWLMQLQWSHLTVTAVSNVMLLSLLPQRQARSQGVRGVMTPPQ